MRVAALGTGTALPVPGHGSAAFWVKSGDASWLIDCGAGCLEKLGGLGVDPRTIDGTILTHRHPDHCGELSALLFAQRLPPSRRKDFALLGGEGLTEWIIKLKAAHGHWMDPGLGALVVDEVWREGPAERHYGPLTLRFAPAVHSAGALHVRVEADGKSVTFSGDTAWSEALVGLARGTDLLVCECSGPDEAPYAGHLWPQAVARLVEQARPREVWLTHLFASADPEKAVAVVAATGVPVRHAMDLEGWGTA